MPKILHLVQIAANIVWGLTSFGNALLCTLMVWKGHYIRFGYLTFAAGLAVIVDAYLFYAKHYHPAFYTPSRNLIFFFWLGINGLIIAEAWRERRVSIPKEFQTAAEIVVLLIKKGGFLWAVYYMNFGLRVTNLLMLLYFLVLFRRTPEQFRKESYEPKPRPEEAGAC